MPAWVLPYWVVQFAGAIGAALFLQAMFGDVSAGGNYPIAKPGGEWRSLVMETVLTAILVTVILNTATGYRSIGHNAALAVGSTVALLGLFASPISGASMNPARTLGPTSSATTTPAGGLHLGPVIGAAIAVAIIGPSGDCPTRRSERPPRAAPCRLAAPRTDGHGEAGKLRLGRGAGYLRAARRHDRRCRRMRQHCPGLAAGHVRSV